MLFAIRRRHEHFDVVSDGFTCRIAEQAFGRGAEGLHDALRVDHDHRVRNGVEYGLQMCFALSKRGLCTFGGGDIACDLRCPDETPDAIAQRRRSERHIDDLPILASAPRFKMFNSFARFEARQNCGFLVLVAGRQKDGDGFAEGLLARSNRRCISAPRFQSVTIPSSVFPTMASSEEFDYCRQTSVRLVQRLPNDVDQDAAERNRLSPIREGPAAQAKPALSAVPRQEAEGDVVPFARRPTPSKRTIDEIPIVRMEPRKKFRVGDKSVLDADEFASPCRQAHGIRRKVPSPCPDAGRFDGKQTVLVENSGRNRA